MRSRLTITSSGSSPSLPNRDFLNAKLPAASRPMAPSRTYFRRTNPVTARPTRHLSPVALTAFSYSMMESVGGCCRSIGSTKADSILCLRSISNGNLSASPCLFVRKSPAVKRGVAFLHRDKCAAAGSTYFRAGRQRTLHRGTFIG